MNAKAISFTPEVLKAKLRALYEYGRCQTRRPVRQDWMESLGEPDSWERAGDGTFRTFDHMENETRHFPGPFGAVSQRLWIRERARVVRAVDSPRGPQVVLRYEVDGATSAPLYYPPRLAPPVVGHCIPNGVFREGARHFLEVVEVRAARVVEISEQDALLEGVDRDVYEAGGLVPKGYYRAGFFLLYDSIYGHGAHSQDWCWVYTLKRAEP